MSTAAAQKRFLPLVFALAFALPVQAGEPAAKPAPKSSPRPVAVTLEDCRGQGFSQSKRAYLGVEATPITPELRRHFGAPGESGVLVSRVIEGGPAARAGVEVGDILTRCGEQKVDQPRDLRSAVRGRKGGESLPVEVFRNGKQQQLSVRLDEKESCSFDLSEVMDLSDLEELKNLERLGELGRMGDLGRLEELKALEHLDIDLSGLDIDGIVRTAMSAAVAGIDQALANKDWQKQLEQLHEIKAEELEKRMEEVGRKLEGLEEKLQAESGRFSEQARVEVERARKELRQELEQRRKEIEAEVQQEKEKARRQLEEAKAKSEKEKAKADKAKAGGSGGGGGSLII